MSGQLSPMLRRKTKTRSRGEHPTPENTGGTAVKDHARYTSPSGILWGSRPASAAPAARPAWPVQRSARLSRPASRMPAAGNRDQAVPVFTAARSAEEEPDCVPAASPQVRRRPSLWPPGAAQPHNPGSSRRNGTQRDAPRPAQIRQVRAGVNVKDVTTPVPRVLLSATLAGPAPSGSTGTSRLCQGCFPPSPAPPGSGCPQLHRPAATGRRRRSLTSTRTTAPHGAT